MKNYFLFTILFLLATACSKDNRERIFQLLYPNFQFNLPVGLSATTAWGYGLRDVSSNLKFYLTDNKSDTAVIKAINPYSARITALDGLDYDFVEEVSVRICNNDKSQCTLADEVFYIDDLRGRANETIELLPTLRNVEKLLIENQFRLEIVFFFRNTTPYTVESKLDMVFEAVR